MLYFLDCNVFVAVANIGRLSTKDSVLFLCDMQEKFRPNIFQFTNIVSNAARVLQVVNTDQLILIQFKLKSTLLIPKGN